MEKFSSVKELAEAYQKKYNASYNNDPQKSFSVQAVIDVCVETRTRGWARIVGLDTNDMSRIIKIVPGFGYCNL